MNTFNDLKTKLTDLKGKRDCIILAHNYTTSEVQEVADVCGDSLALSKRAAEASEKVILFAGVRFMAETAKLLSPEKCVLMPDNNAGCPMADMMSADDVRALKTANPEAITICYINSSVEVKAECDMCVTSGNALEVLEKIEREKQIIFVPDKYLAGYVAKELDREIIVFDGYCPVHMKITAEAIVAAKRADPGAEVLIHPECTADAVAAGDRAFSTGQMLKYLKTRDSGNYIIATENGMLHPLAQCNNKINVRPLANNIICPNMKKNSLEKMVWALEDMAPEITIEQKISIKARRCLDSLL